MEALKQRYQRRQDLRRRVTELEKEVQECRQLNVRIAELCDVVTELLIPVEQRDPDAAHELLMRYRRDVLSPVSESPLS